MGLIGGPLLIASVTLSLFRVNDPITVVAAIATVPIFLWELSLGLWLTFKGFNDVPITDGMIAAGFPRAYRDVATEPLPPTIRVPA